MKQKGISGTMAEIVASNKDDKGEVWSVKLLIGASNADDNTDCYLERWTNWWCLIESNDWNFNIWLVWFLAKKPLMYDSQDVLCTSWGEPCVEEHCQYRI